jgi:hypothetical protein
MLANKRSKVSLVTELLFKIVLAMMFGDKTASVTCKMLNDLARLPLQAIHTLPIVAIVQIVSECIVAFFTTTSSSDGTNSVVVSELAHTAGGQSLQRGVRCGSSFRLLFSIVRSSQQLDEDSR